MESYLEKFIGEKNIEHALAFIRVTITVPITFWILIPSVSRVNIDFLYKSILYKMRKKRELTYLFKIKATRYDSPVS